MLTGKRNGQRGGALVEFAIIAPVLFMFLIGGLEFGYLIYEYHATDYAAKSGARWASVRGKNCSDSSCPITQAKIATFVKSSVPGLDTAASKFSVTAAWASPAPASYPNSSSVTCSSSAEAQGCLVTVTVTNPVMVHIPLIKTQPFTLTSSSTAVVQ